MATVTHDNLPVCSDCALIIVNDDDSGINDPEAHRERMAGGLAALPGTWVWDGYQESDPFSDHRCAACDTGDAGERFIFVVLSD